MLNVNTIRTMAVTLVAGLLGSCGQAMDCIDTQCVIDQLYQKQAPRVATVEMEVGPYGWGAYSRKWPPATIPSSTHTVTFDKGYLEVNEQGLLFDPEQLQAILDRIKSLKNPKRPLFVFTYVHGWHHNASTPAVTTEDEALAFNATKFDYFMARFAEHVRRLYELNGDDDAPQMLGIYIGWRGKSTVDPVTNMLNVGNRAKAADAIARNKQTNSLYDALLHISDQVKESGPSSRLIASGHSLGGRLLSQMFLPKIADKELHPLGRHALIAAIEPAISAACYDKVFRDGPIGETGRLPSFVAITSKDDFAVVEGFSIGHWLPSLDPPRCDDRSPARDAAIGAYTPYVTHIWNFERHPDDNVTLSKASRCDRPRLDRDPRWLFKDGTSLWQYPYFAPKDDCPTMGGRYHADAGQYELTVTHTKEGFWRAGAVWNIQTNRFLIDTARDAAGKSVGDLHNGFASTGLADMLGRIAYAQIKWQEKGETDAVPEPTAKKP